MSTVEASDIPSTYFGTDGRIDFDLLDKASKSTRSKVVKIAKDKFDHNTISVHQFVRCVCYHPPWIKKNQKVFEIHLKTIETHAASSGTENLEVIKTIQQRFEQLAPYLGPDIKLKTSEKGASVFANRFLIVMQSSLLRDLDVELESRNLLSPRVRSRKQKVHTEVTEGTLNLIKLFAHTGTIKDIDEIKIEQLRELMNQASHWKLISLIRYIEQELIVTIFAKHLDVVVDFLELANAYHIPLLKEECVNTLNRRMDGMCLTITPQRDLHLSLEPAAIRTDSLHESLIKILGFATHLKLIVPHADQAIILMNFFQKNGGFKGWESFTELDLSLCKRAMVKVDQLFPFTEVIHLGVNQNVQIMLPHIRRVGPLKTLIFHNIPVPDDLTSYGKFDTVITVSKKSSASDAAQQIVWNEERPYVKIEINCDPNKVDTLILDPNDCRRFNLKAFEKILLLCPNLTTINLSGIQKVDDKVVDLIAIFCPRLRHLFVDDCNKVSDNALALMRKVIPNLEGPHLEEGREEEEHSPRKVMEFTDSASMSILPPIPDGFRKKGEITRISNDDATQEMNFKNIKSLTDQELKKLENLSRSYTKVCLAGCERLSDQAISQFLDKHAETLVDIDISGTGFVGEHLRKEFLNIETVNLSNCKELPESFLWTLVSSFRARIRYVIVDNTRLDDEMMAQFYHRSQGGDGSVCWKLKKLSDFRPEEIQLPL